MLKTSKIINSLTLTRNISITTVLCGKSPAQSQKGHRRTPIIYEMKCIPGDEVRQSFTLVTQKSLKYHPGYNVGIHPLDKSLYSMRPGIVYFSIEKFNPNPKSHFVEKFYPKPVGPIYKKYLHVIPKKDPILFKLVDLI